MTGSAVVRDLTSAFETFYFSTVVVVMSECCYGEIEHSQY